MTTNSPNPVDGDVQALIEYCRRVLHGSNNGSQMEQVYQIALAALTAKPYAYASRNTDMSKESQYFSASVFNNAWGEEYTMPLYTTPPAQLLRPVDLSECKKLWYDHDDLSAEIVCIPLKEIKKVLRQQGYEVKND